MLRVPLLLFALSLAIAVPMQENQGLQAALDTGLAATRQKDFAAAEKSFRSGLEAAEQSGDREWSFRFRQQLGKNWEAQRRWKDAAAEYTAALALATELGNKADRNALLFSLGSVYTTAGDYAKAVDVLDHARAGSLELLDRAGAATALDAIGQIEARRGRFTQGEAALNEALALYSGLSDGKRVAKVRGSLADLHLRRSDYRAALEAAFLALKDDERFDDQRETAKVIEIIGNTMNRIGQPENALGYYRRALTIREQFAKQDLTFSYRNMGAALATLNRHEEALEYLRKSLELGRQAGSQREIMSSEINIGSSEFELGRIDKARESFEGALQIAEAHMESFRQEAATAMYSLGNVWQAKKDFDRALEYHERALRIREEIKDQRSVIWSLNRIAVTQEERGDLVAAEKAHEQALRRFEELGAKITDPVEYGAYRQTSIVLYPHYARVLMKLGKIREALLVSERSRGIGLSRMISLNGAKFVDLLTADDARAWTDVSVRLSRDANRLRIAEEKDPAGPATEEARAAYFESQRRLSELRDRLFASTPRLRAAQAIETPSAAELERHAKNSPDTLYIEWMIVDRKSSLLFAVSSAGVQAFERPDGSDRLSTAENALRAALARPGARGVTLHRGDASPVDEAKAAQTLYEMLLGPVRPLLDSGRYARLVVVPEGPILNIPFPALMDEKGGRLIDRFAISNAVSLGFLLRHWERHKPGGSLLSVADPLGAGETRVVAPSGVGLGHLHEALAEAKAVAAMYHGSRMIAGAGAQEAEIKRLLPHFEILHFATHGLLDESDGMRSGLLLAAEPADSPEDGLLQAWEIAGMSLSARLVVLSACDTARGDERLGDGLLGLAWAFQAAGAPRVAASLWSVDDAATRELMTRFYAEIRGGSRVDDAMQTAARELKKNARYQSPFYWAAFEVLGQAGALE